MNPAKITLTCSHFLPSKTKVNGWESRCLSFVSDIIISNTEYVGCGAGQIAVQFQNGRIGRIQHVIAAVGEGDVGWASTDHVIAAIYVAVTDG